MTYPEIFGGYCLYLKSLVLVLHEAPHLPMVGAVGLKMFEFNTCTLLEKALQTLPSHFKFILSFFFFIFLGTRVWVPVLHLQYQNHAGYVAGQNSE